MIFLYLGAKMILPLKMNHIKFLHLFIGVNNFQKRKYWPLFSLSSYKIMKDLLRLMQILVQFYISINAKGKTGIIFHDERLKNP